MTDITIQSMAGYCSEHALWKMLVDLSSEILADFNKANFLTPYMVLVDGENFRVAEDKDYMPTSEFFPPEGIDQLTEAGLVWMLGALICYASSGHYIFGGRGGRYQKEKPGVELPRLKKEHSALTDLVRRCLCYFPLQRISLKDLQTAAKKGLDSNEQMSRLKQSNKSVASNDSTEYIVDVWPEKMG